MASGRPLVVLGRAAPALLRWSCGSHRAVRPECLASAVLQQSFHSAAGASASSGLRQALINSEKHLLLSSGCWSYRGAAGALASRQQVRLLSAKPDVPHQEIGMPALSPTMTEGNIGEWQVAEGAKVDAGQVLCGIETDKAVVDLENMEDGYLAKILMPSGAKQVQVGTPIAIIVENESDIAAFKDYVVDAPAAAAPAAAAAPPPPPPPPAPAAAGAPPPPPTPSAAAAPPPPGGRVFASPAAKKLAEDNKVNISLVKGTGPEGRIVKADVEDFIASGAGAAAAPTAAAAAGALPVHGAHYVDIPNTQIRKITAQRLLLSKQTVPHYYLTMEVQVDKLNDLRTRLNASQASSGGKKLSVNDFVIKAAALALKKVPEVNSAWTNDFIRQYSNVDVTVAVQTPLGLMVPFVKDADKKGIAAISEDVKRLADKAKEGKLAPEDFLGGTFTISNLGMFGVKQFCAIVNPPQAAILAVGSIDKRVIAGATPGSFDPASFLTVTLSCDHRVVDGAVGAQWLQAFKSYLEDPVTMLL